MARPAKAKPAATTVDDVVDDTAPAAPAPNTIGALLTAALNADLVGEDEGSVTLRHGEKLLCVGTSIGYDAVLATFKANGFNERS